MKTNLFDIHGNKKSQIEAPKFFSEKIREDLITKIIETKKDIQPYAPAEMAGKRYSARGKLHHRRHVWKNLYGRGMSRVPRKVFSRRGSQFSWAGASSPNTKGGVRAHPPRVEHWNKFKKINKKEMEIAFISALSASASSKLILKRYSNLNNEKVENLPLIVESGISKLKTKELITSIKKILGENLFNVAIIKKTIRAGKGKLRGRKYKNNSGLLIVIGKEDKIKTGAFDVVNAKNLSINDLALGGLGRLVIYTENAIKEIGNRLNGGNKK